MHDVLRSEVLITIGLALGAIGAFALASVLFVSKEKAVERTKSVIAHNDDDPRQYNTPKVKALMKDKARGYCGAALMSFGFLLQIVGVWYD